MMWRSCHCVIRSRRMWPRSSVACWMMPLGPGKGRRLTQARRSWCSQTRAATLCCCGQRVRPRSPWLGASLIDSTSRRLHRAICMSFICVMPRQVVWPRSCAGSLVARWARVAERSIQGQVPASARPRALPDRADFRQVPVLRAGLGKQDRPAKPQGRAGKGPQWAVGLALPAPVVPIRRSRSKPLRLAARQSLPTRPPIR